MNDLASPAPATADPGGADDDARRMWLPGSALGCYEGDALLRSWLLTPGLLTQRMRDTCGARFRMNVLTARSDARGHLREIELCCDGRAWVYARTDVPAATLAAQSWLAQIGETALGEALAARRGVMRDEFQYAQAGIETPVVARALERGGVTGPQMLWIRRSVFTLDGAPFTLREVFLPHVGRVAPPSGS